ncbi:diguanylate cyclase (GGDEF)-like protein [Rhodoblastus acidophilus]|uniref:GGDEF domain-containing protein n=1 Tax=Rhodoblastus acidophilus TaxID=1074 RepID=UPI002223FAC7|nr:GGDEF domain-containing protein [Rhodoblastus acidophilus]MCW2286174.1 diguanylate cyclase (GGDEF)-like protein [Rhodoblastus acidophilus]MCW2335068.1 diguanylate cyclase (GGDEF)-like protein [Rhodoblastus acidophilus]
MLAVAAATLAPDGRVIEANAGFQRLLELCAPEVIGARATALFAQPSFATLAQLNGGDDGDIYSGPLTLGDPMKRTQSLRGRVWRVNGEIRLLAEYDVDDLDRLNQTVLELNSDYASTQRELAQANLRLRQREAEILALSLTDPLTGVGNRRRLDEALPAEVKRAERTGSKLCAFVADLDHFKRVNDVYGHEAGDAVLAAFGDCLRRHTRASDVAVRSGGEEFIVLMPHTELDDAILVADRFRASLAATRIDPITHPVTVSVGVAELGPREQGPALIRRADQALYQAKAQGRNKVIAHFSPAVPASSATAARSTTP